jgi:nicotinamide-nucleotide amidase
MPNVEIITIGTELLLGSTLDSNSAFLGCTLAEIGLDLYVKHSIGDNRDRLTELLKRSLIDADGVITTGGLGPTVDDLTKDAIAAVLGVELELHQPSLDALEKRFTALGREIGENNRRQAILPRGSFVLENPHGTAPGFVVWNAQGRFIAALPGVPREMRPMVMERLVPWLRERFALRGAIVTRTLRLVGVAESEIDRRIEALFRQQENPKIAVLAHNSRVDVKIMAKVAQPEDAATLIAPLEKQLRAALGAGIYGTDNETLEGKILERLAELKKTLALAESCTGGAMADALVAVPGASAVFQGGVVAYANAVKENVLGVANSTLVEYGAVSEQTACAMAEGALNALHADFAVSTTGVAGPGGGTAAKPVGLVWIAVAQRGAQTRSRSYHFQGERADIRARAVTSALTFLLEAIT